MNPKSTSPLRRAVALTVALFFPAGFLFAAAEAPAISTAEPPKSWIDPDTGHRVIRLTREPGSDSFYFNYNAFTPDGKKMALITPGSGIGVIDLATFEEKSLVKGPAKTIIVGSKTPTLYYTKPTADPYFSTLWCVNLDSGESRKLADLPRRATVVTINADETLKDIFGKNQVNMFEMTKLVSKHLS